MVVQAYVDESGGKGQGPAFVFSALIASAKRWAKFSADWQACLDAEPAIECFKMNQAATLSGPFHRFTRSKRDQKVRRLCQTMNGLRELFCVVDLASFSEHMAGRLPKPVSDPYFLPFHFTIWQIAEELLSLGMTDRFEIFFDENEIFGQRAKAWYPIARATLDDDVRAIIPVEPLFRKDSDVLPLQAADLTAWLRQRWNARGYEDEFSWVGKELAKLLIPAVHSQYLDTDRFERVSKMILEKSYSPRALATAKAILRGYRETFGRDWRPPKGWKQ